MNFFKVKREQLTTMSKFQASKFQASAVLFCLFTHNLVPI